MKIYEKQKKDEYKKIKKEQVSFSAIGDNHRVILGTWGQEGELNGLEPGGWGRGRGQ